MKTRTTQEIMREIENRGMITEREILLLKKRANAGDKDAADFWPENEIECTPEQSAKGFAWLKNLYKSPRGVERKNNPFGYREMNIIDNYAGENFTFKGFYDAGRYGFHNYVPVYEVGGMEYYNCGGIQIIG